MRIVQISKTGHRICNLKNASIVSTLTATVSSSVSVPGMSEYTDSDFGFSFWYPSAWTVTATTTTDDSFVNEFQSDGPRLDENQMKILEISNGIRTIFLGEVVSLSIYSYCGKCSDNLHFDPSSKTWINSHWDNWHNTVTDKMDLSTKTMGGLYIFWNDVIPLSLNKFIIAGDHSGDATPLVKTILATDSFAANPVSASEQIATIQAEKDTYAGQ